MRKYILAAVFAAILPVAGPAGAHDYKAGDLTIGHPWTRAMPPGAKVGGGFLVITNDGDTADTLLAVTSPRADRGEVHEMAMDGGVMKMRELETGLEIPAGATVELKPGGYHIMFMGVTDGFKEGERVPAVLVFEKSGEVAVEFSTSPVGAKDMPHKHGQTN
ncbi:copper chaperone PCu(A)C [Microbaculum marinum]|uniref:Copper chaperone PCu(A)C n=1 Tax=Microbaculum marinum TaxID=1764581 RepID=A0AAW9RUZ5_9HYPH